MKVLILQGLPASGKSTYAKKLVDGGGWKRVNKDDLRAMLDNSKWSKKNEAYVLQMRDWIITTALIEGWNVVVDDTNLAQKHIDRIKKIATDIEGMECLCGDREGCCEKEKIPVDVKFFDIPLEECIRRDLLRQASVGERVIRQMYNQFLRPEPVVQPYDPSLPDVILCDIDGTIAHMNGRSPFDWKRVGEDTLDKTISDLLGHVPTQIIMMSGRDSVCRPETEEWLRKSGIVYDELFMRAKNDNRKDNIVKRELYEQHIKGKYNVLFVLDDRDQVVDMWRNELGLKVLQVAEGAF